MGDVVVITIVGVVVFMLAAGYACMKVSGDCSEYERQYGLDNGI